MSVIPQTPQSFWGGGCFAPMGPLPGLCPGSAGDRVRSPNPSPAHPPLLQTLDPPLVTRLTRRMLLVEQELLTFPEHRSSPPVVSGVRVTRSLFFFVDRCLSFCTFLLAIVLSVLLRYTVSDCSFGIFKLFLGNNHLT